MKAITEYLKVVFPHSSWLTRPTQRITFFLCLYVTLVLKDCLVFPCHRWFRVLARLGRADSNRSWVWTLTAQSYISKLHPDLQRQTWHCTNGWKGMCKSSRSSPMVWSFPGQESSHEKILLKKSFLLNSGSCWRPWWWSSCAPAPLWAGLVTDCCFTKALLKIRISYFLCIPPQPVVLSTGSERWPEFEEGKG